MNDSTAPAQERAGKRRKPWYIRVGRRLLVGIDRFIARHSLVGDRAFFDASQFSWTGPLEADWQKIRAELDEVLRERDQLPNFQDISEDQQRLSKDDQWKTFFLYGYGYRMEENCERCPETARLIEQVPGMKTAMFSILAPGKHIPAHRGPYKGVLRYHLGLQVPEPREQCRIRVDEQIAHWEEGRSMIFDDTFDHEVWNDTDGQRVVLFMDVERPMRFPASLVNRLAFTLIRLSPFVQKARRNEKRWQRNRGTARS
ncbi:beta-hydroxylase [Kushneria sinocarnis]|uniref:Beta-hydroxylase n=1 Tax=Kushneria sinocarnis TaxID=595502 RepID=A0A420WZZ4_9GAMM|nr:aspartyl/asparaginyl beta-hydroxylase domain-containing protein [Kushneria sinocarnis]RKR06938.1 beta-hydroxylase [Kushneria sinocarnis]